MKKPGKLDIKHHVYAVPFSLERLESVSLPSIHYVSLEKWSWKAGDFPAFSRGFLRWNRRRLRCALIAIPMYNCPPAVDLLRGLYFRFYFHNWKIKRKNSSRKSGRMCWVARINAKAPKTKNYLYDLRL